MDDKDVGMIAEALLMLKTGRARSLRRELGLTVGDMAASARVTPAAVSQWETGKRTPRGETAVRYARALKALAKVAEAAAEAQAKAAKATNSSDGGSV